MKKISRFFGTLFNRLLTLVIALFVLVGFAPLVVTAGQCYLSPLQPVADTSGRSPYFTKTNIAGYSRAEDQTFLTLPEWYIVYSADEFAAFTKTNPPSAFPYFSATRQYWTHYANTCALTRNYIPFNSGYHLSNVVIGLSFTYENAFKGAWENTIGRVAEMYAGTDSAEDALARDVAREYGEFIHTVPWYDFPFQQKFDALWQIPDAPAGRTLRQWERRMALSAEYGTKSLYARAIKFANSRTYAPEQLIVHSVVKNPPPELLAGDSPLKAVRQIDASTYVITQPRYEEFTRNTPKYLERGLVYEEIAGNQTVLVTVLAPNTWFFSTSGADFLYELPLPTEPTRKRTAIAVPVKELRRVLADLAKTGAALEHIYDY